ncbi:MAG: sugar transferase [Gammaproteobacteria bacterium]|nr:sugar transferase [Gammaproteobacteria bacterium]
MAKRLLDLVGAVALLPAWGSVLLVIGLLNLLVNGRPAFYISTRRVYGRESGPVIKFRTMVRDADKIANRGTVPITDQRFLNIGLDSPLYTPLGRIIERYFLTEVPQFLNVLTGSMSLIGNRPLPEDVIASLKKAYPDAELRFSTRCGLSGPVQLVGRDIIDDGDRLRLEIAYARRCVQAYSITLDIMLAIYTALILLRIKNPMDVDAVAARLDTWAEPFGFGTTAELIESHATDSSTMRKTTRPSRKRAP